MESVMPTVQEFQPSVETVQEEDCDTILLYLPGFKKEQLRVRVQLTGRRNMIISGECRLEGQQNVLSRFRKEFPLSTNVEAHKITAKFEGSILFIRQPKLITPSSNQKTAPNPPLEPAMPQKPVDEPQPERKIQEQDEKIAKPHEQLNEKVKNEKDLNKAVPNKVLGEESDQKLMSKDSKNVLDQVATKMEKSDTAGGDAKMAGNMNEKQVSDAIDSAMKKDGEGDDGGKKTLDNYRQSVGGLATKLKTPRKVMNILVVVLMVVIGIYVTNYFKTWKTEEISEV